MKKKSIAFIVASFLAFNIFANDFFEIDVGFEFGFANGTIREYVFTSPIPGTDYMLSRLDWDLNFVKFFGLSADAIFYKYFYVGLSGRVGIPGASGRMQDYDWMNVRIDGKDKSWYDKHYWLTNYSNHDNYLTKYLDGTVKLGGVIYLPANIRILPSVSFQVQEFAFDGVNGYSQYVPKSLRETQKWNDKFPKDYLSGKVISYDQQRLFLFIGLKVYTTIVPRFRFEVEGNFSPLTMIGALDTHWINSTSGTNYLDQPKGLGTWNVSGKVQFSFSKLCRLALTTDYQYVPVLKGKNYSKSTNKKEFEESDLNPNVLGGASSKLFSFSFAATLYF